MQFKAELLDEKAIARTLKRISHEIIEKNKGIEETIFVGIERRGIHVASRLASLIKEIEGMELPVESVDITSYRDDIGNSSEEAAVKNKDLNIDVEGKRIILVDDVLYTGRTARAAIDAIISKGRPQMIQLAVLIDRGHRELPIRADFVGKNVPTSKTELVSVELKETDGNDSVKIYDL